MTNPAERVVLLDVDEVLFPFAHAYDRWLRRNEGFGLDPRHLSLYNIPAAAGPEHDRLVVQFLSDPPSSTGRLRFLRRGLRWLNSLPVSGSSPARAATAMTKGLPRVLGCRRRFLRSKTSCSHAIDAAN